MIWHHVLHICSYWMFDGFPHAPVRPITVYGGDAVRAWYDITTLEESPKRETFAHVIESETLIQQ